MQRATNARGLRFLPKLAFITTVALVSAAISYQATAQNVYTDPVGFITLSVVASGYSYEEAAKIVGCVQGTVKSRVCRARMELERRLDRKGESPLDSDIRIAA